MESDNRILRYLVGLAAFIIIIAGLKAAHQIVVPFLAAVILSLMIAPFLAILDRFKLPRYLSLPFIILMISGMGLVLGSMMTASVNVFVSDIPTYQAKLNTLSVDLSLQISNILDEFKIPFSTTAIKESLNAGHFLKIAGQTLTSITNLMTNAFLILITVTFILSENQSIKAKFHKHLNDNSDIIDGFDDIGSLVNRYMAIKTIVSLITGCLVWGALAIIGVKHAFLFGFIAFLLNFIPTFGSILAAIPAVIVSYIDVGFTGSILVASTFAAINITIGNIIEPRIMGKGLSLSPLVVFISLIFFGFILGPAGLLMAVPLTILIKMIASCFKSTTWLSSFLGE